MHPFLNVIKKGKRNFAWMQECIDAFQARVDHLESPYVLSKQLDDEDLFVYIEMLVQALSVAHMREEPQIQRPVYYIIKQLIGVEINYPKLKILAYCLLISLRKVRPYFQAHSIKVLTEQHLRLLL